MDAPNSSVRKGLTPLHKIDPLNLGPRERQIMEAVYACHPASVSDVLAHIPDPPSYSAVRAILNTLEEKGLLRRKQSGKKFLYLPTVPQEKARRSLVKNLLNTFFNGSAVQAMASLIEAGEEKLSDEDLDRLSRLIENARKGRA